MAFFRLQAQFGVAFGLLAFFVLKLGFWLIVFILNQYEIGRNLSLIGNQLIIESVMTKWEIIKHHRIYIGLEWIIHFFDPLL